MDKLKHFITPDCYNLEEMHNMGWNNTQINIYIQQRINKWKKSTEIFRNMFPHLVSSVHKEFDEDSLSMIVTAYDHNYKQICWAKHSDPLFALAECAKMLNNEDLFISGLMDSLSIK